MASKMPTVLKLTGTINWVSPSKTEGQVAVIRALFRSNDEIVIECVSGGSTYTVHLKRTLGSRFEGPYDKDFESHGNASCSLYSNEEGHLLFGTWVEDDSDYHWWAELKEVETFSDEGTGKQGGANA